MMTIQNVHQVSDQQPSVEEAMRQLGRMMDEALADLAELFRINGGILWGVEASSHNVIAVPGEGRGARGGGPALYIATAMLTVTHNNEAIR